jgi:predicted ATPase
VIRELGVGNFKCFADLRLELRPLSLLTGFNSGGKSSAIQPLLLLAQAARIGALHGSLPLNGSLVRLGSVGEVLPAGSSVARLVFSITRDVPLSIQLSARPGERSLRIEEITRIGDPAEGGPDQTVAAELSALIAELQAVVFLSAVREGQAETFPVSDAEARSRGDVGLDGRYAAYWYSQCVDEDVPDARRHPGEAATTLRKHVDAWLSTLFPGAQVSATALAHTSLVAVQYRSSDTGEWRRPANVGYGFSYAFPILIALLTVADGQTVIIDSPEAHLHPYAQSQMGRLLAHFAAAGVRVIVESHSDHLLNGVRLAVREGAIPYGEVGLYFFSGAKVGDHGVASLRVDAEGKVDSWPEGFFDQSEQDLAKLAGW